MTTDVNLVVPKRAQTRIPVSKDTLLALKEQLRGGEPYDTLIRRMLITSTPKPLSVLTDNERTWVINQDIA
jgi:hypothetical protein